MYLSNTQRENARHAAEYGLHESVPAQHLAQCLCDAMDDAADWADERADMERELDQAREDADAAETLTEWLEHEHLDPLKDKATNLADAAEDLANLAERNTDDDDEWQHMVAEIRRLVIGVVDAVSAINV